MRIVKFKSGKGHGPGAYNVAIPPDLACFLFIEVEVDGKHIYYKECYPEYVPFKDILEKAKMQLGMMIMDSLL